MFKRLLLAGTIALAIAGAAQADDMTLLGVGAGATASTYNPLGAVFQPDSAIWSSGSGGTMTGSGTWTTSTTQVPIAGGACPGFLAAGDAIYDLTTVKFVGNYSSCTGTSPATITLTANAVSASSGSSDALTVTGALGGVVSTGQQTVAFWINASPLSNGNATKTVNGFFAVTRPPGACEANGSGSAPGMCLAIDTSSYQWRLNFNDATGATAGDGTDLTGNTSYANLQAPPTGGQWHWVGISIDNAAGHYVVYLDNVVAGYDGSTGLPFSGGTTVNNVLIDLANANGWVLNSGLAISGNLSSYQWIADYYEDTSSAICTGAGAPYADCAAAHTWAPNILSHFISGSKPVAMGTGNWPENGSGTGNQPAIFLTGNGASMATNAGYATGLASKNYFSMTAGSIALSPSPYGPAGIPAAQATMRWNAANTNYGNSANMTFNPGGNVISAGDYLILGGYRSNSSGAGPANLTCPTGWTNLDNATDSANSETLSTCGKFASSGSVAATASWNGSATTIAVASCPAAVTAAAGVYDSTLSKWIGAVASCSGTTLTLSDVVGAASSGSTDSLTFSEGQYACFSANSSAYCSSISVSSSGGGSGTTLTLNVSCPSWVAAGMQVVDLTKNVPVGTVLSCSGTTLTFTGTIENTVANSDFLAITTGRFPIMTAGVANTHGGSGYFADYANVNATTPVDVHSCATTSTTNNTTPSLTTTAANDTLVSWLFNWRWSNKTFAAPASQNLRFRTAQSGTPFAIITADSYGLASSSNTQKTFTLGSSDTSLACAIALEHN